MAYRTTGTLDDPILTDGDRGFVGVNQRLQSNQLQPGEVRASVNGRMDGFWRPRKAVLARVGALTTASSGLSLPFLLVETRIEITGVSYAANLVTLTVTAHGVAATELADIGGLVFTGTSYNTSVTVTQTGANTLTFPVSGVTAVALDVTPSALNVVSFSRPKVISAVSYLANVVTITITGHGFTVADVGIADVSGITFTGTDYNTTVTLTVADANTLTFVTAGVTAVALGGTPLLSQTPVDDTASSEVLASCLFSDPNDSNKEFVIVALARSAKKIDLETYAVSTLDYPAATTVNGETDMIQCFGKVILFRDGEAALEWDGASSAFTEMTSGDYSQPVILDDASNVVVADGVATLTHAAGHELDAGTIIEVLQNAGAVAGIAVGDQYFILEAPTADTLTFFVNVADGSYSLVMSKPQSLGGGFMHQPGAPWGTYFQRRLFVPFYYDQSGSSPGTFASRGIRDEIAVSDILDENTYDQIYNQFRITGGTADHVVGMHGFYDDGLIVFNRNSLHIITNTTGSLEDTSVRELTNEVGCLARKSIIMKGNLVLFLSDSGVYALEFQDQYNLRGVEEPLSKNVQPYIDRINRDLADKAVGIYFDNRYFLALPLDSESGAGDARGNNSVLVFNFLNKGWESLDTYGETGYLITNFITASAGVRNNLYAVSANGGLHQMESEDGPSDRLSVTNTADTVTSSPITATLTSRGYDFQSLERKRFTDAQLQMQNLASETGEYSVAFTTEDPDDATTMGTTTDFLGGEVLTPSTTGEAETASIRCRLGGVRGLTGTLVLTRTAGSPKIHSIRVAGSATNRSIISQK